MSASPVLAPPLSVNCVTESGGARTGLNISLLNFKQTFQSSKGEVAHAREAKSQKELIK